MSWPLNRPISKNNTQSNVIHISHMFLHHVRHHFQSNKPNFSIWVLTASYVMNVIACPGMIRISRGVIPFHNAGSPSSLAMTVQDCNRLLYCPLLYIRVLHIVYCVMCIFEECMVWFVNGMCVMRMNTRYEHKIWTKDDMTYLWFFPRYDHLLLHTCLDHIFIIMSLDKDTHIMSKASPQTLPVRLLVSSVSTTPQTKLT